MSQIWLLYLCPLWRYEKPHKIWKIKAVGYLRVSGHSRSFKITPVNKAHVISILLNCVPVGLLHLFWDIATYWLKIANCNLSHEIFLCMLSMAVARSSSDGIAIRYLLPVLRMTSCFHTMGPVGGQARRWVVSHVAVCWLTWSLAGCGPLQHTGSLV